LRSLKQVLGKDAGVVDQLPANPLPASLEVTPSATAATPDGARDLLTRLAVLPETDEVAGGGDWVERLAHWQRLLATIALGAGAARRPDARPLAGRVPHARRRPGAAGHGDAPGRARRMARPRGA